MPPELVKNIKCENYTCGVKTVGAHCCKKQHLANILLVKICDWDSKAQQ